MKGLLIEHIAPCGMNCALCIAKTRKNKPCNGCLNDDANKPHQCQVCIVKNCEKLQSLSHPYCSYCDDYPCKRMKQLDKRYTTKYGMSMLYNVNYIKKHGIDQFLQKENKRWTCPTCGQLFSVHREVCMNCETINSNFGVYKGEQ